MESLHLLWSHFLLGLFNCTHVSSCMLFCLPIPFPPLIKVNFTSAGLLWVALQLLMGHGAWQGRSLCTGTDLYYKQTLYSYKGGGQEWFVLGRSLRICGGQSEDTSSCSEYSYHLSHRNTLILLPHLIIWKDATGSIIHYLEYIVHWSLRDNPTMANYSASSWPFARLLSKTAALWDTTTNYIAW